MTIRTEINKTVATVVSERQQNQTLENLMFQVLRKNPITVGTVAGTQKSALSRLVKKGKVRVKDGAYQLSMREAIAV